jgi:large subunit ribosomal protein L9
MSKVIEVIFTETKKGQFQIGQQKFVKTGFARNYLLPQKLALPVSAEHIQQISSLRKKADKKLEEVKQSAENVKAEINGKEISFKVKTHDGGRLYGSITASDIAEEINKSFKTVLDKYDIGLSSAIREAGSQTLAIKIHNDIAITITVNVIGDEEKPLPIVKPIAEVEEEATADTETTEGNTEEVVAEETVAPAVEESKEETTNVVEAADETTEETA